MKRLSIVLLAMALIVLSVAGVSSAVTELRYVTWHTFGDAFVERVEDELGIRLIKVEGYDPVNQAAAGVDFDVVQYNTAATYAQLATGGALAPLDPWIERDGFDLSGFVADVNPSRVDGKLYGLPNMGSVWMVYYNKDIFDRINMPYPAEDWTWSDLRTMARQIRTRLRNQDVYGLVGPPWGAVLAAAGYQSGAHFLSADLTPFAEGLETWYQAYVIDGSMKDWNWRDFANGTIGMAVNAEFYAGMLSDAPFEWDVAYLPVPEGVEPRTSFGEISQGWSILASSGKQDAAWEFVNYMTGMPAAERALPNGGVIAYRAFEGAEDLFSAANIAAPSYEDVVLNSKINVAPIVPIYGEAQEAFEKYAWQAARGDMPIRNAIEAINEEIAAIAAAAGFERE